MGGQDSLQLRGAPIIHDTIDNETIAINQATGRYYSLEGPAADAWQALEGGTTAEALVHRLLERYEVDRSTAEAQVHAFVRELISEELIVENHPSDSNDASPSTSTPQHSVGRLPFPGLGLHRYTDMEVLLLADPIHDVDETGWPAPQRERAE